MITNHRLHSTVLFAVLLLSLQISATIFAKNQPSGSEKIPAPLLKQMLVEHAKTQQMRSEIDRILTPEKRMQLFVRELKRSVREHGAEEIENRLRNTQGLRKPMNTGRIIGNFVIPSEIIEDAVMFMTFDEYGYYHNTGTRGWSNDYWIDDLPPGDYYVMAISPRNIYVDQIYQNIDAPFFDKAVWRSATKVTVTEGTTTENIDFAFRRSTLVLVNIYEPDGTTFVDDSDALFTITRYDDPAVLYSAEIWASSYGRFNWLFIPEVGDYKLGVQMEEEDDIVWYQSSDNWLGADKLTIETLGDTTDSLHITLKQQGGIPDDAGIISGSVTGNGMITMIFAFRAEDLSLVGLGLSFFSSYRIEDLPPGDYYLYAEDYLGNIEGEECMLGTFYPDAPALAGAERVSVAAGENKWGVNITLRKGAAIEGFITDEDGNPLDDLMLVALDMNLPDATAYDLFTQFHFNVAQTDTNGFYRMAGLFPGEYVVRTLSEFAMGKFWGFPITEEGPHKGTVIDVFYPDTPNMLDFEKAQKVAVSDTQTVTGINMALEKAKFIRGKLTDAETAENISEILMAAYVDSSSNPYFVIHKVKGNGEYELGPFPSGKYRVLATANHDRRDFYIPEYYNNARSYDEAEVLEIVDTDLENIDFAFDKAGVIQGHVSLTPGYSAGADTLFNFPVVCFDAADGSYVRAAYVQFDGGFRLPRLLPGDYKIAALPIGGPFAGTYFGGGNSYTDAESQVVSVQAGQAHEADITLEPGSGSISGTITDIESGVPVTNCMVLAYDESGHAIGLGISDDSGDMKQTAATGKYQITGLRAQDYSVSTYSITDENGIFDAIPPLFLNNDDPDLLEMAFSMLEILMISDGSIYNDAWYEQIHLRANFDIPEIVSFFIVYGMSNDNDNARYQIFLPIPFVREIPPGSTPVSVSNNAVTENIDFQLRPADLERLIMDVESQEPTRITDFQLFPNYPNPFNGSTKISFHLPEQTQVTVRIVNIRGESVAGILTAKTMAPGLHEVSWAGRDSNGNNVPTGLYFVLFEANRFKAVSKITLIQ